MVWTEMRDSATIAMALVVCQLITNGDYFWVKGDRSVQRKVFKCERAFCTDKLTYYVFSGKIFSKPEILLRN